MIIPVAYGRKVRLFEVQLSYPLSPALWSPPFRRIMSLESAAYVEQKSVQYGVGEEVRKLMRERGWRAMGGFSFSSTATPR